MTKNKYIAIAAVLVIAVLAYFLFDKGDDTAEVVQEVKIRKGTIKNVISSTGTVLPQNRLEIKPPLSGRIDRILVKEGQSVRSGKIIAWMSSSERAALIDSARASGNKSKKYWSDAYKPIPIVAPITGKVIVRSVEPGQTVTNASTIIVLSDRLIVKADVDETDIGKVGVGQKTIVSLDAYSDIKVSARITHISYESKIINNVTMYEVDVLPDRVPDVFRSGMSANVDIIAFIKENVILVPIKAVNNGSDGNKYVYLKDGKAEGDAKKHFVKTGMTDENDIEIVEGLKEGDIVIIKTKKIIDFGQGSGGKNPFRPQFKKKKK